MVLRMKNFIILGVRWKIWLLWGASWKTNVEVGLPKKGAWTVCWFKGGLARKRKRRGGFQGAWYPNVHYVFSPNCDWFFAGINRTYNKWAIFDISMTITPGANIRQISPFFHLLFELYLFVYFIFAFQDLQNSVAWVSLLGIIFWSVKYTLICERWPFQGCWHRYVFFFIFC